MEATGERDSDFFRSENRSLIERSLREGFDSSLVKDLRSKLWSNFSAMAKRSGVGRLIVNFTLMLSVSIGTTARKGTLPETGLSRRSPRDLVSCGREEAVTRGVQIK